MGINERHDPRGNARRLLATLMALAVPALVVACLWMADGVPPPGRRYEVRVATPERVASLEHARDAQLLARRSRPAVTSEPSVEAERAILLALRWLQRTQAADGSWSTDAVDGVAEHNGARPAMTGLALLAFLAHGDTPASPEFGPAVDQALRWLLDHQRANGSFEGADEHEYCQPIATYALCEAFALTARPDVGAAARRSVACIVKGQNPRALWSYNFDVRPRPDARNAGVPRDELAFTGWCLQAIRSAGLVGLDVPGLDEARRKAVQGLRSLAQAGASGSGMLGYARGPANASLAAHYVGALGLGMGAKVDVEASRQALQGLKHVEFRWDKPCSASPLYDWYYITQVKVLGGGGAWAEWSRQMTPALVQHQVVEAPAGDAVVPVGYWKSAAPTEVCSSAVYNTTLCALMLQAGNSQLRTFRAAAQAGADGAQVACVEFRSDRARL